MNRLQQIEREIDEHIQRPNHCAACLRSITDVSAPACNVLTELNRQAREVSARRKRYAAYKAGVPLSALRDESIERLQKFICVHHNGETYVTWQKDKDAALRDCEENSRYSEPWKVLAYPAWI